MDMPLSSFNKLIYARAVESMKLGGRRKVRPSALHAYIRRCTQRAV